MQSDFITTREAAILLNLHPTYVTKLVREKKIPGYKRGQWRISKSELLAWLESGSNQDNVRGHTAVEAEAERI